MKDKMLRKFLGLKETLFLDGLRFTGKAYNSFFMRQYKMPLEALNKKMDLLFEYLKLEVKGEKTLPEKIVKKKEKVEKKYKQNWEQD